MKNLPPLAALRSFEAVARLGSVSLAAAELNVTHSAVSQQIRLLEDQLGSVLLLREGRGLQPSEDGRLYALQVRVALGELSEATRLVRARPRGDELVIAVLPSFGQHWLLPRLPRFYARHPHYRVTLRASLDIQDLQQGLVDIGIRMGRGGWEGVQQQRLFDDELLAVAAPHFNGGQLPRTAAEVVACPVVRTVESWLGWCSAAGVAEPAHAALWINDSNLVLAAVQQGLGVALLRRSLVASALQRGELVQLTDIRVPHLSPHWLVWPQRESATAKQQDFRHWINAETAGYLAALQPPPLHDTAPGG
ncbi:LysR substrate-binding domain-containing protein [Vogesella indigofera]|uniref:LysR substrate-binding domain-containing protein n=1 Tax=Vogesella indigofera TaxID=45465 RepID=UPI00234E5529|nr:LysR substrate-binding domain-containing protein [Vogesella indigofera]MDC7707141.1 LysR substrate-binding domain-containing protein [Vogesella indigofera]